jgi:amino acid adenylation domain-containing protein
MKNIEDFYPLSPMQQGILFHTLYSPKSGAYIDQFHCPILGNLNPLALKKAWQEVVNRHPILRTSFVWEGLKEPAQIVHKQVELPWQELDWQTLSATQQQEQLETLLKTERERGFNIAKSPLIRLILLRFSAEEYHLVWNRHHLLLDGWSSSVLFEEVFTLYKAFNQGEALTLPQPRPYRHYIAWLQQQDLAKAELFWRQRLQGFSSITSILVNSLSQTVESSHQYDRRQIQISSEITTILQTLTRQHQLTLNTLVQGAWALLLSRYSRETDVVFGGVVSGRSPDLAGSESMVGLFINTLPVRVKIEPALSVLSWLKTLQQQQTEARQYEYTPLVSVQNWSELPKGMPLFESILSFQNYPVDFSSRQRGGNLEIPDIYTFAPTHYPLTVLGAVQSEITLKIIYDCQRFDAATITRMLGHFKTILESIAVNPQQCLSEISWLTEAEQYQLLIDWNQTHLEIPNHTSLHQLFEAQVEQTPDAIAVEFENQFLTYQQLNKQANQLAKYLQFLGVQSNSLVGICVERSPEMLVSLLAVLKAGGAYIPLDPTYPQQRLAFMLEDAQVPVLLTQKNLVEILPKTQAKVICLDAEIPSYFDLNFLENKTNNPEDLAYIIYTSGSTGTPKGVQIQHRAVVNFLTSMQQILNITKQDTFAAITTLSFDIAVLELFLPLTVGAKVVILSRQLATDGVKLSQFLQQSKITFMQATPATWRMLMSAGWQGRKGAGEAISPLKILCGGEALTSELAHQLLERCTTLWNVYGPTETTIWSTIYPVQSAQDISIGRPIANTQTYILDEQLKPVTVGVPGELHIGGMGLSKGYLNRPDLTEQKFISNPFLEAGEIGENSVDSSLVTRPSSRLYKTGDLARYLPDGNIEYLGRIDHQVKVRGFRIELGEIESILAQHCSVQEAVVIVREDVPGDQQIVAYLVARNGQVFNTNNSTKTHILNKLALGRDVPPARLYDVKESVATLIPQLREFLKEKLPHYMIPSNFVVLESLPLTPNGKVDRKSLPAPEQNQRETEDFVAPRTMTETSLAKLWSDILKLEKISIHDNFFELGGHSLLATQLLSRIRQTFKVELPLNQLFATPTIAQLSPYLDSNSTDFKTEVLPLISVPRNQELPLSFAQERLWFLDQLSPGNYAYNMATAVRLQGVLNVPALENSLNTIISRHEALRTAFVMGENYPLQAIASSLTINLPVIDLRSLPATEQTLEVEKLAQKEAQQPFDLAQVPLLRGILLQLGETEHILLLTLHHIIADGWSMGLLIKEVAAFYTQAVSQQPQGLEPLAIQYADFAVWQRQWVQTPAYQTQLNYWKQQLAGISAPLNLPTDRPRPATPSFRGAKQTFALSKPLSEAIATLSRQENVTLFMTLLATFQTLLYRYTQQTDIVVGTDIANRNQPELEPLIGFFVNLLVLRSDLSSNPTFRELLSRIKGITLDAYAHQDIPFSKLVEELKPERNQSHTPFFHVLFVLQNAPMPALNFAGISLTPIEMDAGTTKFDLALFLEETEAGITGTWNYSTDLFDASTITRMTGHFETLLTSVTTQPDTRINSLEMLTNSEKQEQQNRQDSKFNEFKKIKPKAVNVQQNLIKTRYLTEGETLPLVIEPAMADIDLADWAKNNPDFLQTQLLKHGGILFRGFNTPEVVDFENVAQAICGELFSEYGDLPRQGVSGKVYGSTPYPADQAILFHNESSHLQQWPLKIFFYCVQPAQQGGETPLVDCRKIYQLLNPSLRERFAEKQLMYVRNYIEGLDVSWQDFFKTNEKAKVEEICRQSQVEFEWISENHLRTRQIRRAITQHPKTHEFVFFNQLQLHHVSCLNLEVQASLFSLFTEDQLPRHVYYGDGSKIEASVIQEISEIYQQATVASPWQKGDIIMLDNMLAAHGRNPFVGPRKIVVAMGEMFQALSQN